MEPHPFAESLGHVAGSFTQIRLLPDHRVACVEDDVQRKHLCSDFVIAVGEVQIDYPAKVDPNDAILRNADNALLFPIRGWVDAGFDPCIVVTE